MKCANCIGAQRASAIYLLSVGISFLRNSTGNLNQRMTRKRIIASYGDTICSSFG